jgi:hypothetical protein
MTVDLSRFKNNKIAGCALQVIGLLKTLGVPRQMLYVGRIHDSASFWQRNVNHLEVLEQARHLYRSRIACVHPDKPGGSLEQTVQLNVTWGRIERQFKKHGHQLW